MMGIVHTAQARAPPSALTHDRLQATLFVSLFVMADCFDELDSLLAPAASVAIEDIPDETEPHEGTAKPVTKNGAEDTKIQWLHGLLEKAEVMAPVAPSCGLGVKFWDTQQLELLRPFATCIQKNPHGGEHIDMLGGVWV